ncbi:MAG: OsmC family protein [Deltaproteobacteria bacterium]|nr:OsmC family protein [Deltaproteobacteria bacterium]
MADHEEKTVNGVNVTDLGQAIHDFRHDPALGRFQFRATNQWIKGGHNRTTIADFYGAGAEHSSDQRPFQLEADEPAVLLGKDYAPNPVEHLINALAGCMTSAMVYHAAARGIRLESVESELKGEIDVRGFLGIAPEVRKGYQRIDVTFRVQGDGTPEQLAELCRFSPVLDVVSNGTVVNIDVQKVAVQTSRAEEVAGDTAQP